MTAGEQRMRLAVIGCGFIGRVHLANLLQEDGVDLVAVCDIDPQVAVTTAHEFGAQRFTTDAWELCSASDVDALVLATHPVDRGPLALEAIAHGKHLLLEKPVTPNATATAQIARAATEAGIVAAVNFKFRAAPAVAAMKASLGKSLMFAAQVATPMVDVESPHMTAKVGGGLLPNLGSHVFDLAAWVIGSAVSGVNCRGVILPGARRHVLDVVAGQLTHDNGLMSTFCISDVGVVGYSSKWMLQAADGDTAALVAAHGTRLYVDDDPVPRLVDDTAPHAIGTRQTLSRFVCAIRGSGNPVADVVDGLVAAQAVDAAERSIDLNGEFVAVDREFRW
jgi:myo-inositol 2-dehydrogenase/D-chiro-inositol 1-dehydrogenase